MLLTNVYSYDSKNVGDRYCGPALYFDFPFPVESEPFQKSHTFYDNIVLGGGGLFYDTERMRSFVDRTRRHSILWGAGHNTHGADRLAWPDFMNRFSLVGIRDWNCGFDWVPCASCMHTLFDRDYPVSREAVIYEHRRFKIEIPRLPKMKNRAESLEEVIQFLSSGHSIITNSYHGAYWGALLGRRVLLFRPFSTRFLAFRHVPAVLWDESWETLAASAQRYPEALSECREANRAHFERVCNLLSS